MKKHIAVLSSSGALFVESILHAMYVPSAIATRLQMSQLRELQLSYDPSHDDFDMIGMIIHDVTKALLSRIRKECRSAVSEYQVAQLRIILQSITHDEKHDKIRQKVDAKLSALRTVKSSGVVRRKVKKKMTVVKKVVQGAPFLEDGMHVQKKGRGFVLHMRQGGLIRNTTKLTK